MKPIRPVLALAGAVVVFAAGYACAAPSDSANPFLNTKLLSSNGVTYVNGAEADPPPWPSDAPQPAAFPAVASDTAPPPETARVTPDASRSLALNAPPSSALAPVNNPPPAVADAQSPQDDAVRAVRVKHPAKQITFGTTHTGQPVTIIWN